MKSKADDSACPNTLKTQLNAQCKKVFNVIKNDYHFCFLKELDDIPIDLDNNDSENCDAQLCSNRLSAVSKVNFSKLSSEEKDERLKNLARLVKQLRKKLRKYEMKPNEKDQGHSVHDDDALVESFLKANRYLHSYKHFTSEKSKNVLEHFIGLIVDQKLDLDSIYFQKIIKQIKRCMRKTSLSCSSDPYSTESSIEGKTLSTASANSGTHQSDSSLSSQSGLGVKQDNQLTQDQTQNATDSNTLYASIFEKRSSIDYSLYYNYFTNFPHSVQGSTLNINSNLFNAISPY